MLAAQAFSLLLHLINLFSQGAELIGDKPETQHLYPPQQEKNHQDEYRPGGIQDSHVSLHDKNDSQYKTYQYHYQAHESEDDHRLLIK